MASGLIFIVILLLLFAINPAQTLAYARDQKRSDDVRDTMAAILQLSADHPAKHAALIGRLKGREGERFLLGDGTSCAGNWGSYCTDRLVADDCLPLEEIFTSPGDAPIDPKTSEYGTFGTGYYVAMKEGEIEVGSCAADTGRIYLRASHPANY